MPKPYEPVSPAFDTPYPERPTEPIDVIFETPLRLMRAEQAIVAGEREAEYIVSADYTISYALADAPDERLRLTVPRGMLTDLASVPRFARIVVGRVGPHLEAAIVHDWLFIAWQRLDGREARRVDFDFANAMMLAVMEAASVPRWKRGLIFRAVQWFGWPLYHKRDARPHYVHVPPPASPVPQPRPSDDPAPAVA